MVKMKEHTRQGKVGECDKVTHQADSSHGCALRCACAELVLRRTRTGRSFSGREF